jgi:hypothetical protein
VIYAITACLSLVISLSTDLSRILCVHTHTHTPSEKETHNSYMETYLSEIGRRHRHLWLSRLPMLFFLLHQQFEALFS